MEGSVVAFIPYWPTKGWEGGLLHHPSTPGAHLIMFGIRCSPALLQAQSSLLRFMASIYFICQERASREP